MGGQSCRGLRAGHLGADATISRGDSGPPIVLLERHSSIRGMISALRLEGSKWGSMGGEDLRGHYSSETCCSRRKGCSVDRSRVAESAWLSLADGLVG